LRLYDHHRAVEIGQFDLVGSLPDHTLVLDRLDSGHSLRRLDLPYGLMGDVYTWRGGWFLRGWRLPARWMLLACNAKGDVLLRLWEDMGPGSEWNLGILHEGKIAVI